MLFSECFSLLCRGTTAKPNKWKLFFQLQREFGTDCSFVTVVRLAAISLVAQGIFPPKVSAVVIAPELLTAYLKTS